MEDKLTSRDINEEMDGDKKSQTTTASQPPIILSVIRDQTEHIFTEDSDLSSADLPVKVLPYKITETPICNLQNKPKSKTTRAVSICGPCSVEKDEPKPHCPPSVEACTILEVSKSFTSTSRSQESLKTTTNTEPEGEDLCAAILLACLFCHPLDCLLASFRGCNSCIWALCSSFCGCEPTTLQPLLDITHHCDCLGVRCFLCDCPVCDICLQATECLDLAMEISQMLYH